MDPVPHRGQWVADRARDSGGLAQGLFEVALSARAKLSSQGDLREAAGGGRRPTRDIHRRDARSQYKRDYGITSNNGGQHKHH